MSRMVIRINVSADIDSLYSNGAKNTRKKKALRMAGGSGGDQLDNNRFDGMEDGSGDGKGLFLPE